MSDDHIPFAIIGTNAVNVLMTVVAVSKVIGSTPMGHGSVGHGYGVYIACAAVLLRFL